MSLNIETSPAHAESTALLRKLRKIDAYWRACNYLSVGMLLPHREPFAQAVLQPEHIKNRLLGHWGSDPGQSLVWVHLNRLIKKYDLNMMYVSGPGHGAPATLANCYLEGTYSEVYPDKSEPRRGFRNSSNSSPFRAASVVIARPTLPVPSMRAGNSVIACRMDSARPSTIRTSSSPLSWRRRI